jgi:alpha-mannosidase
VLRLYEAHGARGTARLRLGVPVESARLANGLEEAGDELERDGGEVVLPYRPHELLTVMVS